MLSFFSALVEQYPNRSRRDFVLSGLAHGFDIGFQGQALPTNPRNLLSARQNQRAVTNAIMLEVSRGHTAGPFTIPPFQTLHCSPLGAAPKKDGSVRLVLDLSSPRGCSINEGISKEEFSVEYSSFDEAVRLVQSLGPGASMAKSDIRHAFRICPVRLDQLYLLGFRWLGYFFVDTRLPFGSRSSPFIFNELAEVLVWALMVVCGIRHILHYLDDFFICEKDAIRCQDSLSRFLDICRRAGIPIAEDKTVPPSSVMTYLGIEIDSIRQEVRLPSEKREHLCTLLAAWSNRKKCTKRELLSLIGSLSFAAKVVKPGRLFLRRLIDLSTTVKGLNFFIVLNREARSDIAWWSRFMVQWNGVGFFTSRKHTSFSLQLYTDACKRGMGGVYGDSWFSEAFPDQFQDFHINVLEFFAVVSAVFTWGDRWRNSSILFHTDNTGVIHAWEKRSSKDALIMHLIRAMFFFCAQRNIQPSFAHVAGINNSKADALSRFQVTRFRNMAPDADELPTKISPLVWTLLEQPELSFM